MDAVDEATLKNDVFNDGLNATIVIEGEVRDAIFDMLGSHEDQPQSIPCPSQVHPIVQFSGHIIYKSTLVSQLNGNGFLSKDRLTRVKHSMYFNNHDDYVTAAASFSTCLVGIGSDCGVFFVQHNTTGLSSTIRLAKKRKRGW